jgi:undecaprenyl-diphosphatase
MDYLLHIVLGIIQGLTEFLPVSSSAHLTIAATFAGIVDTVPPEQWTAYIAVMQLGTLAAVLLYFRTDIVEITRAFLTENFSRVPFAKQSAHARMGWYVIIGSLPIGTLGLALKKIIESSLTKDLMVIAISMIAFSFVMIFAERIAKQHRTIDDISWRDALIVGMAQTLALMPGFSRSGTTISAGLFVGLNRDVAGRFSFLLSIPAVTASGLLELRHGFPSFGSAAIISVPHIAIATITAGISGYLTIAFLLKYLRTHSIVVFAVYRILLGGSIIAWLLLR